ncbi:MAG TPA: pyridoxamine 5'-phosphate oxidase family protein [Acetivibrio sp.]|uniref:pyridoxamine 5'-phosphate oxidase family protein n=1 Tax=Acetivibrio sp. TaxID=1872092 RepID=UPI002C99F00D|nr:pyridoxamine 5'-phosphate oxidase family protein [Acetivibrio sp.]HOM02626.1 pyridoxamine 5'-phosphate oxidase family protein [Acetivibrio sp.]
MTNELKKEAYELVQNAKIAYVSSVNSDGFPTIKAMLALHHDGMTTHYFSTHLTSRRAAQFKQNPKASIYFCDDVEFKGLMLTGTVEVCTDRYHKELLWREGFEMYYPKGVEDDNYCVLKFTAEYGNYYHKLVNHSFGMEEFNDVEA